MKTANPQASRRPGADTSSPQAGEPSAMQAEALCASAYHLPVMLRESVDGLRVRRGGRYADLTFGGGGHSREILRRMDEANTVSLAELSCETAEDGATDSPQGGTGSADGVSGQGHLYAFDQDADAVANADASLLSDSRFTLIRGNFRYLCNFLRWEGAGQLDGILADLGVSSHHFDDGARGFSFRFDAPLDMRMNRNARLTAAEVVNRYTEERLADVLYLYGELRQSRRMAAAIVKRRAERPIETTGQLASLLGADDRKTLAKVFQALRIEVNQEMSALEAMLRQSVEVLRPGGRLVVITYHSLEDRMVKNLIRTGHVDGHAEKDFHGRAYAPLRAVSHGVITPSAEEQARNPRSRSAKLRIAERIETEKTTTHDEEQA